VSVEVAEMKTHALRSEGLDAPVVGRSVVGADGRRLGRVVSSWSDTIVVERGWLFPTDYFLPTDAIQSRNGAEDGSADEVRLTMTCPGARRVGRIGRRRTQKRA
jgi:hypothetical protein